MSEFDDFNDRPTMVECLRALRDKIPGDVAGLQRVLDAVLAVGPNTWDSLHAGFIAALAYDGARAAASPKGNKFHRVLERDADGVPTKLDERAGDGGR